MIFRIIVVLFFGMLYQNTSAQVKISVLTDVIKYDYYSLDISAFNYGVKYRGETYIPDLELKYRTICRPGSVWRC